MGEKITYDYFYGGQLEAFSYYRLPRVLVTGQQFRGLSTDAKLLYALLLDRMGLSSRNGWYDEQGRVYIYYPVEEIEEDIGCGHGKAVRLLAELDSAKGIGLIERVRQGQGRPTKIFVKQFTTVEVPDFPCPPPPTGGEPMPTSTKMGCQEVPKADGQKYQTHTSGLPKTGSLDVPKSNGNYNNINYPYESYLDQLEHIHQSVIPIQAAAADSAYDFPLAHRVLEEHGIDFYVRPQAVYDRTQVEFKRDAFRYDQEKDRYICPNGKTLRAKRLYRSDSGLFWEYWAEREDCRACPLREKCLSANDRQGARKLSDSYFKPSVQRHLSRWKEPDYKQALKQRQIWCEGTFAIQKRCHNLTRVLRRGLEAAEDHCLLSATALNLRRMIWAIT